MLPAPTVSLSVAASMTARRASAARCWPVRCAPREQPPGTRAQPGRAHSPAGASSSARETGIPVGRGQAQELGLPYGSGPERLDALGPTVTHPRALETTTRTPVPIAAGCPGSPALAAARADIVTLADSPLTSHDDIAAHYREGQRLAGQRAGDIELSMGIFAVNGNVPAEIRQFAGADSATLAERACTAVRNGDTDTMADEPRRRRDRFEVSYFMVNGAFAEQLAPAVERLAGR
jgi:hypothetical protein